MLCKGCRTKEGRGRPKDIFPEKEGKEGGGDRVLSLQRKKRRGVAEAVLWGGGRHFANRGIEFSSTIGNTR